MKKEFVSGKITIIMGIYNCASTLGEALDSLLNQTCTDWNLILCDDGSKDDTYAAAESYREKYPERIILLQNPENRGLNYTLNRCLELADGEFIARMDGDDISMPDRLEKELKALREHPEMAIVSTAMTYFDESGVWGRCSVQPCPQPEDFPKGTPFCHAPCLVRREAYEAVGGYTDKAEFLRVEDYELWLKMYEKGYRGMNLEEPLYSMRDDRYAISRRKYKYRINEFRVLCASVKRLHLSPVGYLYAVRPLITGLMPLWLYKCLHKRRLQQTENVSE